VSDTGGYDLDGPTIRFINGGSIAGCVARIADVIRCAFAQQAGVTIEVSVEEVPPGSGVFKITVRIPGGYIDRGMLTICVRCADNPQITGVTPTTGTTGDLITISGINFPIHPKDICLVIKERPPLGTNPVGSVSAAAIGEPGIRLLPLQVLSSTPTEIMARLGPVPLDANPGQVMIGLGEGVVGSFRPAFSDIVIGDDFWVWRKVGDRGALSPQVFRPVPRDPPAGNCWLFSGPPVDGKICLYMTPDCPWPANAYVSIIARAHDSAAGIGADLAGPTVRFLGGGGSLFECAQRIADLVRCAFLQQAGVTVNVQIDVLADGRVKITVTLPNGYIDRGVLIVCVGPNPTGGP
jgi:hypothetical protein